MSSNNSPGIVIIPKELPLLAANLIK